MSAPQPDKPKKICENILIEEKRYKIELTEAYDELHGRLYAHPHAL